LAAGQGLRLARTIFAALFLTVSAGAFALPHQDSTSPVVFVRGDGAVELNGEPKGSLSDLAQLKASLVRIFSEREKGGNKQPDSKNTLSVYREKPVIVKADASLKYGSVVDVLVAIRDTGAGPIKVEASNDPSDPYAIPPDFSSSEKPVDFKPNPLTLVVTITSDRKLTLNQDDMGTADDTSWLIQRLALIFQQRTEEKVFRPGTDKVEKRTYVKAARSLSFGEVKQVMDAVKQAGADPTGLQIDDLQK
jgi:biopolymer transport protein ExbD